MQRWQRIDSLFQQALQRPPAERAAYLRDACTDDSDLYREVASLVASHPDHITGEPWAAATATRLVSGTASLQPGQRLGPYEITSFVAANCRPTYCRPTPRTRA
jgi:eukaryotic-like serine/threonine-protein kinase